MLNPLKMKWFVLAQPWGSEEAILAGSADPHEGIIIADTAFEWPEGIEISGAAIARHIVKLHNERRALLKLMVRLNRVAEAANMVHECLQTDDAVQAEAISDLGIALMQLKQLIPEEKLWK